MSDKLMDTKLIDEKRQKRLEYCKKYYESKKSDAEYQRKLKEGEKRRYELRKLNPEWVENKNKYQREKLKQDKEEGRYYEKHRIYYQANVEKFNERLRRYYQNKCLTDPAYRDKINERKKEQYQERKIRECGNEILLTMVVKKPGRPRKFNIQDETTTASSGNSETISGNEDN